MSPEVANAIPPSFYAAVGILIVGNLGVLVSLVTFIFKAGKFVASTELGISDAKGSAIRAHLRVDKIEAEQKLPPS
jgi:hypothetical protein